MLIKVFHDDHIRKDLAHVLERHTFAVCFKAHAGNESLKYGS
jgi:hypothetical protein